MGQKGFSAVEGVLIVIIVGIVGFVGWRVYDATMQTNKDLDQAAQTSEQAPQQADTTKLEITDLGVQVTIPDSLKDLTFSKATQQDAVAQTIVEVSEKSLQCDSHPAPLGKLYKVMGTYPQDANVDNSRGTLVHQFDEFYVGYSAPQAACSTDQAMQEKADQLRQSFTEILETITLADS